jgi:uncharacterized protein (TIGR03084 family)
MPADMGAILDDLKAEHADLDRLIDGADLSTPSGAAGWSVGDCVGHLWFFDREATKALVAPEEFADGVRRIVADPAGYMQAHLIAARDLGDQLPEASRRQRADLVAALAAADPSAKVPWYGPPMAPSSFATARLMEYWAHGQDIADGFGVKREPTARLRHIAHLGVRTRGFSYAVRAMTQPGSDVFVSLDGPDGQTWTWGPDDAENRVNGSAEDFCLVVTQRRPADETELTIEGADAAEWMSIAQAFAGGPTTTDPTRRGG